MKKKPLEKPEYSISTNCIVLTLCVALLFCFGAVMVFNTTSGELLDRLNEANIYLPLIKQLTFGAFGIFIGLFFLSIGYEKMIYKSPWLLFFTFLGLLLLYTPYFGQTINGSRRWLGFFGFSFQPSELVKVFLPMVYIFWFSLQKKNVSLKYFLEILFCLSIPILLILLQPDHGTTVILFSLLVVLFFLTKIRFSYWALPLMIIFSMGVWGAFKLPYVRNRIEVYLHPELDLKGKGHQPHQAKIAAGSGRLLGRGLGESLQKLNYLPEARSDYIAAIYAEEFGFIGMLGLITVYMVMTFSGLKIASTAKDYEGYLLACSLTFLISIQAFLNLGIVSGLLPSKGTTLPYFSQGGSSLVVNIIAFFLLLDIGRKSKKKNDCYDF